MPASATDSRSPGPNATCQPDVPVRSPTRRESNVCPPSLDTKRQICPQQRPVATTIRPSGASTTRGPAESNSFSPAGIRFWKREQVVAPRGSWQ